MFCVDFVNVKPFRSIDSQFLPLGISFENATSVKPSNPLFRCESAISPDKSDLPLSLLFQSAQFVRVRMIGYGIVLASAFASNGQHLMSQQLGYFNEPAVPNSIEFVFYASSIGKVQLSSDSPILIEQILFSIPTFEALPA